MSEPASMLRVRQTLGRARTRAQSEKVRVVMGNEAADLDSMVSAVMFAWYLGERDAALASLPEKKALVYFASGTCSSTQVPSLQRPTLSCSGGRQRATGHAGVAGHFSFCASRSFGG